jgi:hypothetical protein
LKTKTLTSSQNQSQDLDNELSLVQDLDNETLDLDSKQIKKYQIYGLFLSDL